MRIPARHAQVTIALCAVALLAASCTMVPRADATPPGDAAPDHQVSTWVAPSEGLHSSYIATGRSDELVIFDAPGGAPLLSLPTNETPTTLALVGRPGSTQHVEVHVPGRPNGRTGWVDRDDIELTWTNYRVRVELGERRLQLFDEAEVVLESTVAVGSPTHATPLGSTYVVEVLLNPDPGSLYGPMALGLALWSNTVTEYAGGDGQIALHGTNRPDLLGQEVSHGCVRVSNDVIRELAGRLPLGTPVDIVA